MTKNKKILEEFSAKEVADAMIIPQRLTKKGEVQAKSDLAEARKKVQASLSDNDRLTSKLLQFKLQLDDYLQHEDFHTDKNFGHFLKEYILLLNRKRKVFAQEIDIKETELSQIINHHRAPAEYIIMRLEIHSNNTIPVEKWLGLIEKEKAYSLKSNKELRRRQKEHVTHKLEVSI